MAVKKMQPSAPSPPPHLQPTLKPWEPFFGELGESGDPVVTLCVCCYSTTSNGTIEPSGVRDGNNLSTNLINQSKLSKWPGPFLSPKRLKVKKNKISFS